MFKKLLNSLLTKGVHPISSSGESAGTRSGKSTRSRSSNTADDRVNTLVFTSTRMDGQYVIREVLSDGARNPVFLFTSRSQAHFDALLTGALPGGHKIASCADDTNAPGVAYDPIEGCRDNDEIFETLEAFDAMGANAAEETLCAIKWIRSNNLIPTTPMLISLLSSERKIHPDSRLPESACPPMPDEIRSVGLTRSPFLNTTTVTAAGRYFNVLNAALEHPWLDTNFANPRPGVILRVDKNNRAHRFQTFGILRDYLRRDQAPDALRPTVILDEADGFMPPSLMLRALATDKMRIILMPEIADRLFSSGQIDNLLPRFDKLMWFRTHSGGAKALYEKIHAGAASKVAGSAYDISCATLNLHTRITRVNGASTYEDLAALSGKTGRTMPKERSVLPV